jgi:hypothetical protein
MGFGLLSYSREPLLEGSAVPENSVKPTGQGTLGGLHQYSITEAKCECCEDCPDCDCKKCKVDKDFKKGGPGDDFALGYPMQASKAEHADAEPPWSPWETPQPASGLDEFRRLTGMGGDDASYLPSPMSTGNRNVYSAGRRGILDPGPEPEPEPELSESKDKLGKADTIHMNYGGTRYKFDHGIFIDAVDKDGTFRVAQAGQPTKKLGVAKSLEAAKKLALKKADFSESVGEAAKQSSLGKAPVSEEYIGEADPKKKEKSAPEAPEPGGTAGRATRSRKDDIPKAGKQMRSEIEDAVRKLKAKYGLPRDTGWKAPPAPKPEPPEDKN